MAPGREGLVLAVEEKPFQAEESVRLHEISHNSKKRLDNTIYESKVANISRGGGPDDREGFLGMTTKGS